MRDRESGDDLKHVDEGRAESLAWHPPLLATHHHCRQQQRQQEQDVVIALPNVLHACGEIVPELLPRGVTARPEHLPGGLWAENRRACLAAHLYAQKALVLRVNVEE